MNSILQVKHHGESILKVFWIKNEIFCNENFVKHFWIIPWKQKWILLEITMAFFPRHNCELFLKQTFNKRASEIKQNCHVTVKFWGMFAWGYILAVTKLCGCWEGGLTKGRSSTQLAQRSLQPSVFCWLCKRAEVFFLSLAHSYILLFCFIYLCFSKFWLPMRCCVRGEYFMLL